MVELLLQERVALLGEVGAALREVLHIGVVVNIKVLGLEHPPVEFGVLDLVATEVEKLRVQDGRSGREQEKKEEAGRGEAVHRGPVMLTLSGTPPEAGRRGAYQEVPFLNTETNRIAASVRTATTSPIFCSLVMRLRVPVSVCR